jgi:hypothetical protein
MHELLLILMRTKDDTLPSIDDHENRRLMACRAALGTRTTHCHLLKIETIVWGTRNDALTQTTVVGIAGRQLTERPWALTQPRGCCRMRMTLMGLTLVRESGVGVEKELAKCHRRGRGEGRRVTVIGDR